jgi:uncharacterized RDD family membrane protein YckC
MTTMSHLPDPDHQPQFYAGVPTRRLVAWIVDMVVIFVLTFLAGLLTFFVGFFFWVVLFMVVSFAYRVVTIASGSATWGMRFAGIEFRDQNGTRLDFGLALAHTAGYSVSIAIPVIQLISIVMMLTSPRAQGLTDTFLGTVALNKRAEF